MKYYKVPRDYNFVGDAAIPCCTASLYTVALPEPPTGQSGPTRQI